MRPARPIFLLSAVMILATLATLAAPHAAAQSQAVNGTIEGIVTDISQGALPGVTVTITNVDNGSTRSVVSDSTGTYRAPLLSLGNYRVRAELQGFKTLERSGLSVSAGQTVVVNLELAVGGVQEVVQVTASVPLIEPGKIDFGRTIGEVEFKNLPLVSRNTFNFALLQPNVTGYEDVEFGATRVNANGSQMHTNYQIDGSSATQKNRAGLRMFQPSEIMVREVKVISNGFAPEFGQTTGMIYNAVTPSGTNRFGGDGSYRFRRKSFSARPFTLSPTAPTPDTHVDDYAGTFGGPIVKDKTQFYVGYERVHHDLSADRVITVTPATATALGLAAAALGNGVVPAIQTVNMFIAKIDHEINPSNRLSARWSLFNNATPENLGAGLNTREVQFDFQDRMDSASAQLVSSIGSNKLNELRIAYGRRNNPLVASAAAGPGPSVIVSGVANFGGVRYSPNAPVFLEDYWQIVNNVTWVSGVHEFKFGVDVQIINDKRGTDPTALYTFADTASYLAAKTGANPFSYGRVQQNVGKLDLSYAQRYFSGFVQDDWRLTPRFKLLFGLRYDLFRPPDGDPNAPLAQSKTFRTDKNNIGPRAGFAWSLGADARTVVRGSTGVMYEPPLGLFYENALLENGNPKIISLDLAPGQPGAPAYPAVLSGAPAGVVGSPSIRTVNPDFNTQYAVMSNVQVERGLATDLSVSAAYVNATGRNLPFILSANAIPSGATLPDGRPIYSSTVSAATRVNPSFNTIREVRSEGTSQYNALTLSIARRMSHGVQASAFYTLAKAQDNGVIGSDYVVGSIDRPALSDPSNPKRDYSYTAWNQTHTFVMTTIIQPSMAGNGIGARLANDNQIGLVLQANSGLPYNIRSNRDVNLDGITDADRPNGIARNSGKLGKFVTVDMRYSRFVPVAGRQKAEVFAELKNMFNRKNIRAVNPVVTTDALGNLAAPIPDALPLTATYEARQFQLGFKYHF